MHTSTNTFTRYTYIHTNVHIHTYTRTYTHIEFGIMVLNYNIDIMILTINILVSGSETTPDAYVNDNLIWLRANIFQLTHIKTHLYIMPPFTNVSQC